MTRTDAGCSGTILDEHCLYRLQQYLLREAHCPVTNEPVYLFPLELLAGFYQPPGERQYHVRPGLGWFFDFQMPAMERLCNTGAELGLPARQPAGRSGSEGGGAEWIVIRSSLPPS